MQKSADTIVPGDILVRGEELWPVLDVRRADGELVLACADRCFVRAKPDDLLNVLTDGEFVEMREKAGMYDDLCD